MVLVCAHVLFTTKTFNHEKLTLHYCRYFSNWLDIRIFCLSYRRKYNTRFIGNCHYCVAVGRYQESIGFLRAENRESRHKVMTLDS